MYVFYECGIDKIYTFCTQIYSNRAISAMYIILQQFHSLPHNVKYLSVSTLHTYLLLESSIRFQDWNTPITPALALLFIFTDHYLNLLHSQWVSIHPCARTHTHTHIFAKFKATSIKQMPKSRISVLKDARYTLTITGYTFTIWGSTTASIHFRICFVLSRGLYIFYMNLHKPPTAPSPWLFVYYSWTFVGFIYVCVCVCVCVCVYVCVWIIVAFILNMQFSLLIFFSDWSTFFSLSEVSLHGYPNNGS